MNDSWLVEDRATAALCGGTIRLTIRTRRMDVYTSSAPSSRKEPSHEVVYESEGCREIVASVDELRRIVERRACDVVANVERAPEAFALIVASLLRRSRVIVVPDLYDFLDPLFDMSAADSVPRVVDRSLVFTLVSPSRLEPGHAVDRVRVDLDTFVVTDVPVVLRA